MYKALGSSVDPNKLALTFKGAIPLIIFASAYFGLDLETTELDKIITTIGMIASGIVTLIGILRKIIVRYTS